MEIIPQKVKDNEYYYKTLHHGRAIGNATMYLSLRTPRSLWYGKLGKLLKGFSPLTPEEIEPTKEYLTGVIYFFDPNGGTDTARERHGNGSKLLTQITSDAKSTGAEMLAVTLVSNNKMRDFLIKHGFMHLPRSRTYIKKI
jgi:hypothetical protein